MTETEKKAQTLLNECGWGGAHLRRTWNPRYEALCRAIERHEAFRQEVSDAVSMCRTSIGLNTELDRFIIAKPDPLVEAMIECGFGDSSNAADDIRAALAKRGLEIREKGE